MAIPVLMLFCKTSIGCSLWLTEGMLNTTSKQMKKLLLIKKSLNEDLNNTYVAYLDARIFHESFAATTYMAVLPGVLRCSFDRLPETTLGTGRTGSPCDVPFRYASVSILDFGFRISDF